MNWKKNVFSYILWAISSIAVGIGLFSFVAFWGSTVPYAFWMIMVICGVALIGCAGLAIVGHKVGGDLGIRVRQKGKLSFVMEDVFFLCLIGVSIYFTIVNMPENFGNGSYYEQAKVSGDKPILQLVHGISYLYLQLLRLICIFFGNKVFVCIAIQIFLYYLSMLVFYFAIRRMAGLVPAVVFWVAAMFSPFLRNELTQFSPMVLYLLLFAVVTHFIVECMHVKKKGFVPYLLTGIAIAMIGYLDVTGFILFFVLCTSSFLKKEGTYETVAYKVLRLAFAFLGLVSGFFGSILLDSLLSGKAFGNVLGSWWSLYCPKTAVIPTVLYDCGSNFELIFLFVGLGLGIFSFTCRKKCERSSWLILSIAGVMLLQSFQMTVTEMNGSYLLYMLVVALAGVGIGDIFEEGKHENKNTLTVDSLQKDTIPVTEIVDLEKTEITQETEEPAINENSEQVENAEQTEVAEQTEKKQTQFIENPLPLPKKHVPKTMDYDIEISEEDDYDI